MSEGVTNFTPYKRRFGQKRLGGRFPEIPLDRIGNSAFLFNEETLKSKELRTSPGITGRFSRFECTPQFPQPLLHHLIVHIM